MVDFIAGTLIATTILVLFTALFVYPWGSSCSSSDRVPVYGYDGKVDRIEQVFDSYEVVDNPNSTYIGGYPVPSPYLFKVLFYDSMGNKVAGQNIGGKTADVILRAKSNNKSIKVVFFKYSSGKTSIYSKSIVE